jgi:pyrroloquinoline quinone (PQQ) biosynthesis protein C
MGAARVTAAVTAKTFLAELRREIETHPATNHIFLNRLATGRFSREDYRVFGENHYPLVCVFTSYLETLLRRAPASQSKMWLAKVLVDEYGEGSRGEDHATLYAHFLRACGSRRADTAGVRVPAPAMAFIREHRRIVEREPFLVGLGAVGPGHEWAIPRMFDAVIPGLRRAGFNDEEIQYFVLHVAQDVDHGAWLEEALERLGTDDASRALIRRGAWASLGARERFWTGVQRAVVVFRQPRAVRPDGPRPRSIAHEILLTAWDGSRVARAAESTVASMRERFRPTLEGLVASVRR